MINMTDRENSKMMMKTMAQEPEMAKMAKDMGMMRQF